VTQGLELFADQIPLVAEGLQALRAAAGHADPFVLVFDRGGYSAEVFRTLNVRGVGWVTWLRAKVALPTKAFADEAVLPSGRHIRYACFTYRVPGCHDHVAAIAWHEGDPLRQAALLHNTDRCQPGRWEPTHLIALLAGRWVQENSFKTMKATVDIAWTNGYRHLPAADTPVPNPEVQRLRARLALRSGQLRRAMDRPVPRHPAAAARLRRRIGTLQGQITRLTRRLQQLPPTVAHGTLGRKTTAQLHPGRGLLFPVLRAAAYHLRLQLRVAIAAVFPDHREHHKVLRVLLSTPGRYAQTETADWVVLRRPPLPPYAHALAACIAAVNADPPHSPSRPTLPLRLALEN
jgi:plasmid stabilization system protein ParE